MHEMATITFYGLISFYDLGMSKIFLGSLATGSMIILTFVVLFLEIRGYCLNDDYYGSIAQRRESIIERRRSSLLTINSDETNSIVSKNEEMQKASQDSQSIVNGDEKESIYSENEENDKMSRRLQLSNKDNTPSMLSENEEANKDLSR